MIRRPCWCTKEKENVARVYHNNSAVFPKDFFAVVQYTNMAANDVMCKPRKYSPYMRVPQGIFRSVCALSDSLYNNINTISLQYLTYLSIPYMKDIAMHSTKAIISNGIPEQ